LSLYANVVNVAVIYFLWWAFVAILLLVVLIGIVGSDIGFSVSVACLSVGVMV
jgi:hypothetical protein